MNTSPHRRTRVVAMIGTLFAFAVIVAATLLGIAAHEPAYVFPFFCGLLLLDVAGSAWVKTMHGWHFEAQQIRSNTRPPAESAQDNSHASNDRHVSV